MLNTVKPAMYWGSVREDESPLRLWDLVLVAASIQSVILLLLLVINDDPDVVYTAKRWDLMLCLLFLSDWLRRLFASSHKVRYCLGWGMIDLLGSLPMIDWLRWMRLVRVARVLMSIRHPRNLWRYMISNSGESSLAGLSLLCLTLLISSSLLILHFESEQLGANITNGKDAFWWALVTVTTVGYGDFYPVSEEGRLLALGLMICGIGCFSTFAGYLASLSIGAGLSEKRLHDNEQEVLHERINTLEDKLDQLLAVNQQLSAAQAATAPSETSKKVRQEPS